ncbi:ATP-binding protein [Sinorhizobium medicae]
MSTEVPEILLAHYLKTLKLPTFQREYQKLAQLCATEGVDHVGYLFRLGEREVIERDRRKVDRRIKAAKFPVVKSLDSFDFAAIPKLNKMQVLELARCEWIERRENVIALGPSGTGKTHVALGLGLAACQKGLSVGFTTAAALVSEMMEARDERRLLRFQKQMAAYKLLIIDELGYSATIRMRRRIASPELLPENGLLPHLNCSRRINLGSCDEEGKHGDTCGIGGGDQLSLCIRRAGREGEDVG